MREIHAVHHACMWYKVLHTSLCGSLTTVTSIFFLPADIVLSLVTVVIALFLHGIWYYLPNQAELQRTGLPPKPTVFVNRDQEQFDIINSLSPTHPSFSRVVTITGAPGHGKSALATVCGYRLHEQGLVVRHIDLRSAETDEDAIRMLLNSIGTTHSKSNRNKLIEQVKGNKRSIVLILDNADFFTLSSEHIRDKFNSLITLIVENSHDIQIIITTQYKLKFTDHIRGHLQIQNLTEAYSLEFLHYSNPGILQNKALTLVSYTEGIPLALTILSSLMRDPEGPTVDSIIDELLSHPLRTLSREDTDKRLSAVFSIATNYLDKEDRLCFVIISLFPSSFTHSSAAGVLANFVSNTECISHLNHRSLLEYNQNTKRCHMLQLLQLHGRGLVNIFERYEAFNVTFVQHYIAEVLSVTQRELFSYLSSEVLNIRFILETITDHDYLSDANATLEFARFTFDVLPFFHPMGLVHNFWMSVHKSIAADIMYEGLSGNCTGIFAVAMDFEVKLAVYLYYKNKSLLFDKGFGLFEYTNGKDIAIKIEAGALPSTHCIEDQNLLRYIIYLALHHRHNNDNATYERLLNTTLRFFVKATLNSKYNAVSKLSTFLYDVGEYNLAISLLSNALEDEPNDFRPATVLGEIFRRSGQYDRLDKLILLLSGRYNDYYTTSLNEACADISDRGKWPECARVINMTLVAVENLAVTVKRMNMISYERPSPPLNPPDAFFQAICNLGYVVVNSLPNVSDTELLSIFSKTDGINSSVSVMEVAVDLQNIAYYCNFFVDSKLDVENMRILLREAESDPDSVNSKMTTHAHMMNHYEQTVQFAVDANLRFPRCEKHLYWSAGQLLKALFKHERQLMKHDSIFLNSSLPHLLKSAALLRSNAIYYGLLRLAILHDYLGDWSKAKNHTQLALEHLSETDLQNRVLEFLELNLKLAKYEFVLKNYVTAFGILVNCSFTINELNDSAKHNIIGGNWALSERRNGLFLSGLSSETEKLFIFKEIFKLPKTTAMLHDVVSKQLHWHPQFLVLFLVVWASLILMSIILIESHYFLYCIFVSVSPIYRMYHYTPTHVHMGIWNAWAAIFVTHDHLSVDKMESFRCSLHHRYVELDCFPHSITFIQCIALFTIHIVCMPLAIVYNFIYNIFFTGTPDL